MSKSQLQTNNSKLSALIAELQGKATGGSGSVETCTVEIDMSAHTSYHNHIENYVFLVYQNNSFSIAAALLSGSDYGKTMSISNVVCGSVFYIIYSYHASDLDYGWATESGLELLEWTIKDCLVAAKAPTQSGVTGVLRLEQISSGPT